jgi:hypothetical protein
MSAETEKLMSSTIANEPEVLNHDNTDSNIVNTPIAEQFDKLKQIFLVNDTAKTFEQSLRLLFILIRESMILIWLALCWGVVALNWANVHLKQIGQGAKSWWNAFQEVDQHKSKMDIATEIVQNTMQNLVAKAKKQVGLQDNQ